MVYWSLDDIAWHEFDASKIKPDHVSLVKAAAMVEHNGHAYASYLCDVFADDPVLQRDVHGWAEEEVQHGKVLRRWAELADPTFDFDKSFRLFTSGYALPVNVTASVRGSRSGELLARCVVETATSAYYTAMKENTDEPVLKAICARIAADEYRHYKLFYTYLKTYLKKENIGVIRRCHIALQRIIESEDDELVYAFFAAHNDTGKHVYNHAFYRKRYLVSAYGLYQKKHIQKMIAMMLKAIGMTPHHLLSRALDTIAWNIIRYRRWLSSTNPAMTDPNAYSNACLEREVEWNLHISVGPKLLTPLAWLVRQHYESSYPVE